LSQSSRTELASGVVNNSGRLLIELIERPGKAPVVGISWPAAATVSRPAEFDQVVASVMRTLANGVITLAAIRVDRRL
jgi:hypothetical protein